MKLLIFGGTGELGARVRAAAKQRGLNVVALPHVILDVTRPRDVRQAILFHAPDVVVNCAGIVRGRIDVADAEYVAVNALAPYYLADACLTYGARMVQVSTDCVFSGLDRKRWRFVTDITDPIDLYGRSKALGEVVAAHVAVVRTSFTGPTSRLWRWLEAEAAQGTESVEGWRNQLWSGSTSQAVAETLVGAIAEDALPWGAVTHLATADPISKYEAVDALVKHLGLSLYVDAVDEPNAHLGLRPTITLPSFREALAALVWATTYLTHQH